METLRIERTTLSQIDFAVQCGIPPRTYQRWVAGETESRPTPAQLKAMCRLLGIKNIEDIPDDFGPQKRQPSDRNEE